MSPDLDVIVVTYNSGTWVDRLIPSIGDARTIVVDNASTDGTLRALERYDVEVIANTENRYLSPAWNQALARSSAPYVVLLNPDCEVLTPGWTDKIVALFEEQRDIGIIGVRLLDLDGTVSYHAGAFRSKWWALSQALYIPAIRARLHITKDPRWNPTWERDTFREVDVVSGACLAIRREMLERIGGIDEGFLLYWEENDLCIRSQRAGYRTVLLPDVEIAHAIGASVQQVDPLALKPIMEASLDRYFSKHHGRWFAALVHAIRATMRAVVRTARAGRGLLSRFVP